MATTFSNKDRLALNDLMTNTYSFTLQGTVEKGSTHMQFLLTAPTRFNGTYYTVSGFSIEEAIDNWHTHVSQVTGRYVERPNSSTLYEFKSEVSEVI